MPPTLPEQLLHQLVVGEAAAIAEIVEASRTSDDPMILVAAGLFAVDGAGLLAQARAVAATARDHLVNVLVAWIAGASHRATAPPDPTSNPER